VTGLPFDHDDSLTDSVLDEAFHQTGDLWMKTYGDPNYTSRGGNRGEPPADFFLPADDADISSESEDSGKKILTPIQRKIWALSCCCI